MGMNGAIILYKERGISSFSAVSKVRRITGADKAGHTGTLDPMAEGVLVVCLGKHTRLAEYLMKDEKAYRVTMLLGIATDTYDLEGSITDKSDISDLQDDFIAKTILGFVGTIEQKPPVYSAVKVKGRKLYEYARKGVDVTIPERRVEIKSINNLQIFDDSYGGHHVKRMEFDVSCSKGTYIRSICNDIGKALGSYGTMSALVRTKNGCFDLSDAHGLDEIEKAAEEDRLDSIIIDSTVYLDIDSILLDENDSERFMKGIVFETGKPAGDYLAVLSDGRAAGIASVDEYGKIKSRKRLI